MYFTLCLFKMINSILEKNAKDSELEDAKKEKNESNADVDPEPAPVESSKGITFQTAYFEIALILISLISIYLIKKVKSSKSNLIIYGLIITMNVIVIIQFVIDTNNPLIKIQFLYTLAFSFGCRLSSFFFVSAICVFSSVTFLNISLGNIQSEMD